MSQVPCKRDSSYVYVNVLQAQRKRLMDKKSKGR